MKTIALVGTFDSKGEEFRYARDLIEELGFRAFTIHVGSFEPLFEPDISNAQVAAAAGVDIGDVIASDRAFAADAMCRGLALLVPQLYREEKFDGILSFGGSGGTTLATAGMRELPLGVPKVMVSTMASGNVSEYVGTSDIVMMPSLVDVAGINRISRTVFENAVMAVVGMVGFKDRLPAVREAGDQDERPMIAATMFGVTTPCVTRAKKLLEDAGYQVIVFHANGAGGRMMEKMIDEGMFEAVLDLTTTEVNDDLFGGVLTAGPHRLEAAIRKAVPQVVSAGACEMINFGHVSTVPEKYASRKKYEHNPANTLIRMTESESAALGRRLAEKWNESHTEMTVLLPLGGLSMLDTAGGPFDGPQERSALFGALRDGITNPKVHIMELDHNINDPAFAQAAVREILRLLQ